MFERLGLDWFLPLLAAPFVGSFLGLVIRRLPEPSRSFVRVLMLTGQRRDEVLAVIPSKSNARKPIPH